MDDKGLEPIWIYHVDVYMLSKDICRRYETLVISTAHVHIQAYKGREGIRGYSLTARVDYGPLENTLNEGAGT